MPSNTFLNLPESKRNNLINVALNEFSKMPLSKVSLNKIIKDANISHGSFYTYFKDKEDLYYYILSEHHKIINDKMRFFLKDNNGDIILMFKDLFNHIINLKNDNKDTFVLTNVFENMNFRIEKVLFLQNKKNNSIETFDDTLFLVNTDLLSVDNNKLNVAFGLLVTSMINSLVEFFVFEFDKIDVTKNYYAKLSIIEKGIYKTKENDIC